MACEIQKQRKSVRKGKGGREREVTDGTQSLGEMEIESGDSYL